MSRIRTIKPEFWGHWKTARVSRDARLLFLGLINESDDEGKQLGSPKTIAGVVYPNDDDVNAKHVEKWLDELEVVGLIYRYEVDGVRYLLLPGFTEHQKVSHPTPSRLPSPSCISPEVLPKSSGAPPEVLSPDLGSGSRIIPLAEVAPEKPPKKSRARNPLFDALVDVFGPASTDTRASMYAKVASELKRAGADENEITRRGNLMLQRDWKDPTPLALAKHWDSFDGPAKSKEPEWGFNR